MFNREQGKTKQDNPMATKATPFVVNAVKRSMREVPSREDVLISRLVNAYNNKAFANPNAPLLTKGTINGYSADGSPWEGNNLTASSRDGERLGFLAKDKSRDGIRYGFGIDNINSRYRDIPDTDINTPLGTLDFGSDYDTFAAGFTPNAQTQAYITALAKMLGL